MTWILAGNCINGFACVADTQMTLELLDGSKRTLYFNCLKKIHAIHTNVCVAFSGDVRSGLLMIERLKNVVPQSMGNGYFDLDGQAKLFTGFLRQIFREFNPKHLPPVELVFCWNAQEGSDWWFRPFCMRFRSPDFNVNSTPLSAATSFGSGAPRSGYKEIQLFLSGKQSDTKAFEEMFATKNAAPRYWTVSKFKTLAIRHGAAVSSDGVSRSMTSCAGVIDLASTLKRSDHERLTQLLPLLGIAKGEETTSADRMIVYSFSLGDIETSLSDLARTNPQGFTELIGELSDIRDRQDFKPLNQVPELHEEEHFSSDERRHTPSLLRDWASVEAFLRGQRIRVQAAAATA